MDILVVTFRRTRYLAKCLAALDAVTREADDVLVWNNSCTKSLDASDVVDRFADGRSNWVCYDSASNVACAGGRNRGFRWFDNQAPQRQGAGDRMLMLDDDVFLCPGWRKALKILDNHSDAGVVSLWDDHRYDTVIARHEVGGLVYQEKTWINTAAAIVSKGAFREIGGYYESGKAMDWISTKFCMSLRAEGWRVFSLAKPKLAENMDHPSHKMNERDHYEATGYAEMRRQGKQRKVRLGEEGRFFEGEIP